LPSIECGAVRGHFQQGKIDNGAVEDGSVADAGDGDEALHRVEDPLRRVEVGAGDAVHRGSVDPLQRARFFEAVRCCGQGYRSVLKDLINQQVHRNVRLLGRHAPRNDQPPVPSAAREPMRTPWRRGRDAQVWLRPESRVEVIAGHEPPLSRGASGCDETLTLSAVGSPECRLGTNEREAWQT
jgi:hypothetical protein